MARVYQTKLNKEKCKDSQNIRELAHPINDNPSQKERNASKQTKINSHSTTGRYCNTILSKRINPETNKEIQIKYRLWTSAINQAMPLQTI